MTDVDPREPLRDPRLLFTWGGWLLIFVLLGIGSVVDARSFLADRRAYDLYQALAFTSVLWAHGELVLAESPVWRALRWAFLVAAIVSLILGAYLLISPDLVAAADRTALFFSVLGHAILLATGAWVVVRRHRIPVRP